MSPWPARAAIFLLSVHAPAFAQGGPIAYLLAADADLIGVGTADGSHGLRQVTRIRGSIAYNVACSMPCGARRMRVDHGLAPGLTKRRTWKTSGSIAPALLYDEFDGFQPRLRFQVDMPLPSINQRFQRSSGASILMNTLPSADPTRVPSLASTVRGEEDETLFGIRYREPKQGGRFEADAGLRLALAAGSLRQGKLAIRQGRFGDARCSRCAKPCSGRTARSLD